MRLLSTTRSQSCHCHTSLPNPEKHLINYLQIENSHFSRVCPLIRHSNTMESALRDQRGWYVKICTDITSSIVIKLWLFLGLFSFTSALYKTTPLLTLCIKLSQFLRFYWYKSTTTNVLIRCYIASSQCYSLEFDGDRMRTYTFPNINLATDCLVLHGVHMYFNRNALKYITSQMPNIV